MIYAWNFVYDGERAKENRESSLPDSPYYWNYVLTLNVPYVRVHEGDAIFVNLVGANSTGSKWSYDLGVYFKLAPPRNVSSTTFGPGISVGQLKHSMGFKVIELRESDTNMDDDDDDDDASSSSSSSSSGCSSHDDDDDDDSDSDDDSRLPYIFLQLCKQYMKNQNLNNDDDD